MNTVIPTAAQLYNGAEAILVVGFVAAVVYGFFLTVEWFLELGQSRLVSKGDLPR